MGNIKKRRTRTFPGSIYPIKGFLYVKFKGLVKSTGLKDNREGRQLAEQILKQMWMKYNMIGIYSNDKILISKAYADFKNFKQNRSPKTSNTSDNAYNSIIQGDYFLSLQKIEMDVVNYIKNTGHSKATVNTYLTHIQTFMNYCTRQKWIEQTYFKKDFKKKEKIEVEEWTDNELQQILKYFQNVDPEVKDIIELSLYTGARISDCVNIKRSDIDFSNHPVTVKWYNKISKDEEVRPVINYVANILERRVKKSPELFRWSINNKTNINKLLSKACIKLNIERGKRSFQEFRVTFANNLLKNQIDKVIVQYLLRHHEGETIDKHYTTKQKHEVIEGVENVLNHIIEKRNKDVEFVP